MATDLETVLLVTGLSGAGKSVVMRTLEDMSFETIDNLPVELVETVVAHFRGKKNQEPRLLALGIDTAEKATTETLLNIKSVLDTQLNCHLVFLDCKEGVLLDRYSTTRRRHPLKARSTDLRDSIRKENIELLQLKNKAEVVMDTTYWSPHFLSRNVEKMFSNGRFQRALNVTLTSFGFKNGQPRPLDGLYDVRFITNPYFDPALRKKTGLDSEVVGFIEKQVEALEFLEKIVDLHTFLLPKYHSEGKYYLRIGIGCTGGQHRSVWLVEKLGHRLKDLNFSKVHIDLVHRDLE